MALIVTLALIIQGCGIKSADKQDAKQETTSAVEQLPERKAIKEQFLDDSNLVAIAVVSSVDTNTKARVRHLLESANIYCRIEGSVGDGVFVPRDDVLHATEILKSDAATNRYWIEFPGEPRSQSHEIEILRPH